MTMQTPIKRHKGLVSFSREHHFGLLLVWKIRQGLNMDISPDRISRYVLFFFNAELKKHFRDEEDLLFSRLENNDPKRLEAEDQHKQLYMLIRDIEMNRYDFSLLSRFAGLVEKHIRFEERVLFRYLQEQIDTAELDQLESRFLINTREIDDLWEDVFWEIKK